jgi:hypothetical protein
MNPHERQAHAAAANPPATNPGSVFISITDMQALLVNKLLNRLSAISLSQARHLRLNLLCLRT